MAGKETREVATAEWTDPQGGTVTGKVVKQNGTSVYVEWNGNGHVERIPRTDQNVRFKTADES